MASLVVDVWMTCSFIPWRRLLHLLYEFALRNKGYLLNKYTNIHIFNTYSIFGERYLVR